MFSNPHHLRGIDLYFFLLTVVPFYSSFFAVLLGAVETESRGILWEKTRQAFMYAKNNLLNDYDFFMKADDDSYVIVENLRFILSKMDPNVPFIMGRRFKVIFLHSALKLLMMFRFF